MSYSRKVFVIYDNMTKEYLVDSEKLEWDERLAQESLGSDILGDWSEFSHAFQPNAQFSSSELAIKEAEALANFICDTYDVDFIIKALELFPLKLPDEPEVTLFRELFRSGRVQKTQSKLYSDLYNHISEFHLNRFSDYENPSEVLAKEIEELVSNKK